MKRLLNPLFTLALLFGVAYLSITVIGGDAPEERLTVLMGFVALGMAVIIGTFLVGPVLLKTALAKSKIGSPPRPDLEAS